MCLHFLFKSVFHKLRHKSLSGFTNSSPDCVVPFKRTYALRTECERYNSRFKSTDQERLWVRNGTSAANLNTLAHISALAVALAAVLHGSHSYRSAKQLRRSA